MNMFGPMVMMRNNQLRGYQPAHGIERMIDTINVCTLIEMRWVCVCGDRCTNNNNIKSSEIFSSFKQNVT